MQKHLISTTSEQGASGRIVEGLLSAVRWTDRIGRGSSRIWFVLPNCAAQSILAIQHQHCRAAYGHRGSGRSHPRCARGKTFSLGPPRLEYERASFTDSEALWFVLQQFYG